MDRGLGTRPKNPKLGWFRPENRHFVLFSALGYTALKNATGVLNATGAVIPVPAPARKKEATKGQPTSPPPPRPCPPLLWLSGQLPPTQRGRGASSQNSSSHGGGRSCRGQPARRLSRFRRRRPQQQRGPERRPARPLGTLVKL